ncbi:Retrovirus-related Pol polyprotein from transposon TNT 1-94 [Eumeta japonica]|uniref:Retrovirus-related Pol polyprotein from transposon TNT 1-94 n=1 Tax=Eumeta variegata TaxID=151549 RepID=A0A4C1WKA1_EUMVA|nr:Retrovirus-related Pol polyprotein from transposon TNT 1-94 [Eumeta japonica]
MTKCSRVRYCCKKPWKDLRKQWLEAVQEELQSFEKNFAWELVDVPKDGTIVQCKWVLRKKYDSENNVRYRARLVAKDFTQKYGVDYTDTFSPVVRHTTLRLLFALSVKLGLNVTHLDVKTAFLNGDLEETIYMKIPDCYNSSSSVSKVLKLKRPFMDLSRPLEPGIKSR